MPFDALTVAAVRQQLDATIAGGRVQRIAIPGPLSVALEVYRSGVGRSHLLLTAHPQHARAHLLPASPSRDPEQQPPIELLLRKYVRGGTIVSITQPAHERILALSIDKRLRPDKHHRYHSDPYFMDSSDDEDEEEPGPDVPPTRVELIIEIMGKLSNIVLVAEDGTVMDAVKRIPSSLNRYRVTLPNHPYVAPPPQDKYDAGSISVGALSLRVQQILSDDPQTTVWKALVSAFSGVSPTLARETTFRALGTTRTPAESVARDPQALEALLAELSRLLGLPDSGAWEPCVAWGRRDGDRRALDFAPYRLRHLEADGAEIEGTSGISEAAAAFYEVLGTLGGHSAVRGQVRAELAQVRGRDERRLRALQEQIHKAQALEELRRKGEFLLSFMHTLSPGQRVLEVPGENLAIDLDPALTPVENAQAYFKEYHKAKSAQADLPALIEDAELRLRYLDELATSLDIASTLEDIRAVKAEIDLDRQLAADRGEPPTSPGKQASKGARSLEKLAQPLRLNTGRGVPVLVGRTGRQNDAATFRLAAPQDLWFHALNVPGAHVILRAGGGGVTEDDIREAAEFAAGFSSARQEGQVDVVCTERRYVRKVPNSPPGLVTYRNERVMRVAPRRPGGR